MMTPRERVLTALDHGTQDYTRAAEATNGRIDLHLLISDLGSRHGPLISVSRGVDRVRGLVITPAGRPATREGSKLVVDGVAVEYAAEEVSR